MYDRIAERIHNDDLRVYDVQITGSIRYETCVHQQVGYVVKISGFLHFSMNSYLLFTIKCYDCQTTLDDILEVPYMFLALASCGAMTAADLQIQQPAASIKLPKVETRTLQKQPPATKEYFTCSMCL